MSGKCGCRIEFNMSKNAWADRAYIVYCPIHESAEEMLNALKSFAMHPESLGFKGIKEYSQQIIAKASHPWKE